MNAQALFHQGKLDEAIEAMNAEVRANPADPDRRSFLGDLLCIQGNFERADIQLDAISKLLPGAAAAISLTRQLVRGEQWRQQCFVEGRLPEFLQRPTEGQELHLRALLLLREGDRAGAAELLNRAEELRAPLTGTSAGVPFEDFRDGDDMAAGLCEVLTSTGKYFWIPMERITRIELRAVERPRDLLWRRAGMEVRGGPDGEVFLPAIYAPAPDAPAARLGRETSWSEEAPVLGSGLRTFLVGEDSATLMELTELTFESAES